MDIVHSFYCLCGGPGHACVRRWRRRCCPPPISCGSGIPGGVNCIVSKKDLKEARSAFQKGVKLQDQQHLEEAFDRFDEATRLAPQSTQFLTAREVVKAQLVFNHIQRGNTLLLENERTQAAAEFRAALELDADNDFARERLVEASRESLRGDTSGFACAAG